MKRIITIIIAVFFSSFVKSQRRNSLHSSGFLIDQFRSIESRKVFDNFGQDINEILRASESHKLNSSQFQLRSGSSSTESTCSHVKHRLPGGIRRVLGAEAKDYYTKYTEAYRIPVMSHNSVPDAALKRACYVLRFLLADRSDLRQAFYSKWGRVVVLGKDEFVHDLPEFNFLKNYLDNEGVANLKTIPATDAFPLAIAPEENLLCHEAHLSHQRRHHQQNHHLKLQSDGDISIDSIENNQHLLHIQNHYHHQHQRKYFGERSLPKSRKMPDDIFLKSLAIGIFNLAVKSLNPVLKQRLDRAYLHAMASDWWTNTESAFGPESYFGEGVQSFYDANAYSYPPDGFNNDINLRTKLRSYDTALYMIVHQVFPCANSYHTRCSSRGNEAHLRFEMDCRIPHWQ